MTPREGFKYGFLLRCAEEGLTVKQAEVRATRALEKHGGFDAWDTAVSIGGGLKDLALGGAGKALSWGIPLGIGTAAGAGALGGYGLAKLREGDTDPEEVQRQELIAAYRNQAELARRKAIMDAAQRMQARPKSHFGI